MPSRRLRPINFKTAWRLSFAPFEGRTHERDARGVILGAVGVELIVGDDGTRRLADFGLGSDKSLRNSGRLDQGAVESGQAA